MSSTVTIPIRQYAKTAAELAADNFIHPLRQLVIASDTGVMKLGDGVTAYNSLPVLFSASSTWGGIGGNLPDQIDLQNALNTKQATLVSGTNIKSVNGSSLLGSGDLTVTDSSKLPLSGGTLSGVLETNSRISPSISFGSDLGSTSKQFNALYVYDINVYNGKLRLSESSNVGYIDGKSGIRLRTNGGNTYFYLKATGIINLVVPTSSAGLDSGDIWNDSGTLKIV